LPWVLPYALPANYKPEVGKGVALTEGKDVAITAYGPVMLSAAVQAARTLQGEHGISAKVINLAWLNHIDADWLVEALDDFKAVFSIDNHYLIGGQGDRIADALASKGMAETKLTRLALNEIPACGTNPEILREHALDQAGIIKVVLGVLNNRA
jgi:transketolase